MTHPRAIFGRWRLSGYDKAADFCLSEDSRFDELVLPNAGLHIEVMSERPAHLWMCIHGVHVNVDYASKTVMVADECEDFWKMVVDSPECGDADRPPALASAASPDAERADGAAAPEFATTGPPPFAWVEDFGAPDPELLVVEQVMAWLRTLPDAEARRRVMACLTAYFAAGVS